MLKICPDFAADRSLVFNIWEIQLIGFSEIALLWLMSRKCHLPIMRPIDSCS